MAGKLQSARSSFQQHLYRLFVVVLVLTAVIVRRWHASQKAGGNPAAVEGTFPSMRPADQAPSSEKVTTGKDDDYQRALLVQPNVILKLKQTLPVPKRVRGVRPAKKSPPPSADTSNRQDAATTL